MMAIPNKIEFTCQHIPNDPKHINKKPNYQKNPNKISSFQTCDTTTNPQSTHCLFLHIHMTSYILLYELTCKEFTIDKKCKLNKWKSIMCKKNLMKFFIQNSQICRYSFLSPQLTNTITRTPKHHNHKVIRPFLKSREPFITSLKIDPENALLIYSVQNGTQTQQKVYCIQTANLHDTSKTKALTIMLDTFNNSQNRFALKTNLHENLIAFPTSSTFSNSIDLH